MKATWKLIGTLIKRKTKGQTSPSRIITQNKTFTNKLDIAEQFNKYFISVGPSLASTIDHYDEEPSTYINKSPVSSFIMSPVEVTQVCRLFQNVNENKSSLDIPNKLIKIASEPLSIPFAYIYNQSIAKGILPDVFKISRVTPIYKSGEVTDTGNYRPIATLSSFSKVLERLIYNQLYLFLEKNDIIYKYQFGFRKGYSTEQAVLEITDNLNSAIDNKQITCGLFLDFSKAFDTVNHDIFCSLNYILMESVQLHLNGLKATYAIALNNGNNGREHVTPYYNLLGILKFETIYRLKVSLFAYKFKNDKSNTPAVLLDILTPASEIHSYNTRYASNQNFFKPSVCAH